MLPEHLSSHTLVNKNQDLVRILAAKLYKLRWSDELPYDDYYQNGMVGLLEAANRFDPKRGIQFKTFASPRIIGSILDGVAGATERSRQLSTLRQRAIERAEMLSNAENLGNNETEASLARIANVAVGLAIGFMLEGTGLYSEGGECCNLDGYTSTATNQARDKVRQATGKLSERTRKIIEMHYFEHMSFIDIAEHLQLTKGRISQLHHDALVQLRGSLGNNLSDFEA